MPIDGLVERSRPIQGDAHLPTQFAVDVLHTAFLLEKLLVITALACGLWMEQRTAVALSAIAIGVLERVGGMHAQSLRTERNAIDIACKVTIVPRGQALGATQIVPLDDQHNYPRTYLLARLAVGLGGRVAEELETGESTTGAENDLQEVTKLAREMVTRWGMSRRIGNVFLGREVGLRERQSYSEHTAALIDEEVQQVIGERSTYVHHLLSQRREELERVAQALLAQESLDEQQLHRLVTDVNVNAQLVSEGSAIGDSLAAPAPKG